VNVLGVGATCAFGAGAAALWQGALTGACALTRGDVGFVGRCGVDADMIRVMGAVAREAIADAGLVPADLARAALVLGTTTGGMKRWLDGVAGPEFAYHGPAAQLARELELGGPVMTPSAACASGAVALATGLELLRAGEIDVALCGGADTLTPFVTGGFATLGALDAGGPARPFDRDRAGLSLGEGAGFVVLARPGFGARSPRARLLGAALTGDGHHATHPDPSGRGAARALTLALADAGVAASDVGFVSAHGTGTRLNDHMEGAALCAAGLGHAPVHGLKGAIGHTLGAAGALEAVLCVRVLESGVLPPTAGHRTRDPLIPLDIIAGTPRTERVRACVSTSSGFGGANVALVVGGA
jgi:3-oxoacyl-[acyl-carrier-protein] synthase II